MKVSVAIPAYNEEKLIGQCLDALMHQTEPADEIVVVDNNCTDRTVEIAGHFPVRIVREPKQGMIPARNRGFDSAQFEIIARCDADTVPPTDWIAKIKKHFENPAIDGVSGPYSFYDLPHEQTARMLQPVSLYTKITKRMLGHYPFFGGNMAIRKSRWEKIRAHACTDEDKVHEDIDLSIHLTQAGGTILFDPTLVMRTSARRMRYPLPSLLRYIAKWPGTKLYHSSKMKQEEKLSQ